MARPAERNARRARLAAVDLAGCATWASGLGLHLLVDGRVEQFFAFESAPLPPGTVDGRQRDALSVGLADPSALLVTVGGFWLGLPIRGDSRWREYERVARTWAVLVVSRLSGGYYGLHVHGHHVERFVGGVREEPVHIEALVELVDGATAEIVRTTIDYRVTVDGDSICCADVGEALRRLDRPVVRIDSDTHDAGVLSALVEAAGVLPERRVIINGAEWQRRPALEPVTPSRR